VKTILVDLQYSAISNGKFLVLSDSNFDVNLSFFKHLTEDFHIIFTLPGKTETAQMLKVAGLLDRLGIAPVFIDRDKSPFVERFNLRSFDQYEQAIKLGDPDILYCNNPSTIAQLKLLAPKAKVIAYNHWIDSKKYPKDPDLKRQASYNIRQCEGHILADYTFLNSLFAKEMLMNAFLDHFDEKVAQSVCDKIHIFPPTDNFPALRTLPAKDYTSDAIVFNHRLSSFPYYKDNFIDCMQAATAAGYQLTCTDSSGKGLPPEAEGKIKYLGTLSPEAMNQALRNSSVHLSLFRPGNGGMWSISIMRAIRNLNAVIIPNHSGYREMVPPHYGGLVSCTLSNTTLSVHMATKLLNRLKDCDLRQIWAEECYNWFRENHDIDIYIDRFKHLLETV
jgi:glycosyltransferase involved in cell wall biosynthesis